VICSQDRVKQRRIGPGAIEGVVLVLLIILTLIAMTRKASAQSIHVDPIPIDQPQTFTLKGIALGTEVVHIWAWPETGPVFLGAVEPKQPVGEFQLATGGYELVVRNAPLGEYYIVLYARSLTTGKFSAETYQHVKVRPCVFQAEHLPPLVGKQGRLNFFLTLMCR
jgi:hypothetical protein